MIFFLTWDISDGRRQKNKMALWSDVPSLRLYPRFNRFFLFIFFFSSHPSGLSASLTPSDFSIVIHLVYCLEQAWHTGRHLKPQTTGCNKTEKSSNPSKVIHSLLLLTPLSSYPTQKIKNQYWLIGLDKRGRERTRLAGYSKLKWSKFSRWLSPQRPVN